MPFLQVPPWYIKFGGTFWRHFLAALFGGSFWKHSSSSIVTEFERNNQLQYVFKNLNSSNSNPYLFLVQKDSHFQDQTNYTENTIKKVGLFCIIFQRPTLDKLQFLFTHFLLLNIIFLLLTKQV